MRPSKRSSMGRLHESEVGLIGTGIFAPAAAVGEEEGEHRVIRTAFCSDCFGLPIASSSRGNYCVGPHTSITTLVASTSGR